MLLSLVAAMDSPTPATDIGSPSVGWRMPDGTVWYGGYPHNALQVLDCASRAASAVARLNDTIKGEVETRTMVETAKLSADKVAYMAAHVAKFCDRESAEVASCYAIIAESHVQQAFDVIISAIPLLFQSMSW